MAKTVVVVLRCDRCKAETGNDVEGTDSLSFGYDGFSYTLDLCVMHAGEFRKTIESLISWSSAKSRLTAVRRRQPVLAGNAVKTAKPTEHRAPNDREHLQSAREWARQQGYRVPERGRIPMRLVEQYEDATKHSRR